MNGISLPAAASIDLRWGDTALANFFGTSARADAADSVDNTIVSMLSEPEGVASPFVRQAFGSQTVFRQNQVQSYALSAAGQYPQNQPGALVLIVVLALVAFVVAWGMRK